MDTLLESANLNGYPDHSAEWEDAIRQQTVDHIRRLTPVELVLPETGRTITAIRPHLVQLIAAHAVPDQAIAKIGDFFKKVGAVKPQEGQSLEEAKADFLANNVNEYLEVVQPLVCTACVSPRFTTDALAVGKGVFHISYMHPNDVFFVWNWMNGVDVATVSSFRGQDADEPDPDLGGVRADEVVRRETEREARNSERDARRLRRRQDDLEGRRRSEASARSDGEGSNDAAEESATLQDGSGVHLSRSDRRKAAEDRRSVPGSSRDARPRRGRDPRGNPPRRS